MLGNNGLRPWQRLTGLETVRRLEQRVADLEADMTEMRRQHLRLAELADVVQELLVPLASRDETAVAEALERYRTSL